MRRKKSFMAGQEVALSKREVQTELAEWEQITPHTWVRRVREW